MSKRIVFIDYIRVIACFLVMLVHSSENFYCWTADTSMLANESNRLWVAALKWITSISKLTFGMYLMHILFLSNIAPLFMPEGPPNPILPIYLTIPCIAILTYVCCAISTKAISIIPGSKWIIG